MKWNNGMQSTRTATRTTTRTLPIPRLLDYVFSSLEIYCVLMIIIGLGLQKNLQSKKCRSSLGIAGGKRSLLASSGGNSQISGREALIRVLGDLPLAQMIPVDTDFPLTRLGKRLSSS